MTREGGARVCVNCDEPSVRRDDDDGDDGEWLLLRSLPRHFSAASVATHPSHFAEAPLTQHTQKAEVCRCALTTTSLADSLYSSQESVEREGGAWKRDGTWL